MEENQNHTECNYTFNFKPNPWRDFVSEMWFKHKDEVLSWTHKAVTEYELKEYFHKNKWFLKREFKLRGGKVKI